MTTINNNCETKDSSKNEGSLFLEIRNQEGPPLPTLVEAYVAIIQPRHCSSLMKRLSRELPLIGTHNNINTIENNGANDEKQLTKRANANANALDLSHLKRVKKTVSTTTSSDTLASENENGSPSKKKQKTDKKRPLQLEILLREVDFIENHWEQVVKPKQHDPSGAALVALQKTFDLAQVETRMVPGRPPESHQEWQDFQTKYWPTNFFAEKSKEHLEKQLQLSQEETQQMITGMEHAIQDAQAQQQNGNSNRNSNSHTTRRIGAVIVNPLTGKVVSTSNRERELQLQEENSTSSSASILQNPLATSILLAIQGVSRLERNKAIADGMDSSEFQKGQYLCTGYDLYATYEPTVFEAMALVHSRIRRVVFGCTHAAGAIQRWNIHALPSTNHHYRAFHCQPGSALWDKCQSMQS